MFVFHLNKKTMLVMVDTIKEIMTTGELEIAVIYSDDNHNDDIADWNEADFKTYAGETHKLAELAATALTERNELISINILTNVLMRERVEGVSPDFLLCHRCVCTGCMINKLQFKIMTGFENIPPVNFCRRAFLEYSASQHYLLTTGLSIELEKIDHKEFLNLMTSVCGNMSLDSIGRETYGL